MRKTERELLLELRAEIRQLRVAIIMQQRNRTTPRQARTAKRHARVRELAMATGLGISWNAAEQVSLILKRQAPAPEGYAPIVEWLRDQSEFAASSRRLWEIIRCSADASVDSLQQ